MSTFTRPGSAAVDLKAAWKDRLANAEALLAAGHNGWAIATGLHALEIRLKVLVCRRLAVTHLPRAFETHDLASLLLLAGLSARIERKALRAVRSNWNSVVAMAVHLNDFRYTADAKWTAVAASDFFTQLRDPPDGVLTWLDTIR